MTPRLRGAACAAAAALALALAPARASAHDPRYPQYDNFLASLYHPVPPQGTMASCCDVTDCRALTYGDPGQPGVEAWYDRDRRDYAFIAKKDVWKDTGDDQVYHVPERDTQQVQQMVGKTFVKAMNPTDNLAFACFTPGRAWCMVPPLPEF